MYLYLREIILVFRLVFRLGGKLRGTGECIHHLSSVGRFVKRDGSEGETKPDQITKQRAK